MQKFEGKLKRGRCHRRSSRLVRQVWNAGGDNFRAGMEFWRAGTELFNPKKAAETDEREIEVFAPVTV